MLDFFEKGSPFEGDKTVLRSISTGLSTGPSCNVDSAKEIGSKILATMCGVAMNEYVFKKTNQAILMTAKQNVPDTSTNVDPFLLFQRLLILQRKLNLN